MKHIQQYIHHSQDQETKHTSIALKDELFVILVLDCTNRLYILIIQYIIQYNTCAILVLGCTTLFLSVDYIYL